MATVTPLAGRDALTTLPRMAFGQIFSYLPKKDAANLSLINKKAREVFCDEAVQEELIRTSFGENAIRARPNFMLFSEYYQRLCIANGIHARGILEKKLIGDVRNISFFQIIDDGTRALSWDGALKLWNLETGLCLHTYTGQSTVQIKHLQISSDSTKVFGTFWDGSLYIWNLETDTFNQINSGRPHYIRADGTIALLASASGIINLYDLNTHKIIREFKGHTKEVSCLKLNYDKTKMLSFSYDNTLKLWNFETGACIYTFIGHRDTIDCLKIKPDWTKALSGSKDDIFRLWNLETGECIHEYTEFCQFELNKNWTRALCSRVMGESLILLDFTTFQTDRCIEEFCPRYHGKVEHLFIDRSWTFALANTREGNRHWNLETGISSFFLSFFDLYFSSDWTKAFAIDYLPVSPDNIKFFDLRSARCLQTLYGPIYFVRNMRDGSYTPVSLENHSFKIWNFSSLPLERISAVVKIFLQRAPNAQKKTFEELVPRFVKDKVFRQFDNRGLGETEMPNVLCNYIKKFFLIDIIDLFEKAEAMKSAGPTSHIVSQSELFHRAAFKRFEALPDLIKTAVYEGLPSGEFSFQSEETSDQTRIEAIRKIIPRST